MQLALLFVTTIVSALAAGCAAYLLNISRDRLWFTANKAEELYCIVDLLERELSKVFARSYSLIDSRRTPTETRGNDFQGAGIHFASARMLVGFYFPLLSPTLARSIAAATSAHAALQSCDDASAADRESRIVALDNAVIELKDALEAFKANVVECGRKAQLEGLFALLWRPAPPKRNAGRVMRVRA